MLALSAANAYLWKCWRDTRSTFFVLVGGLLGVGAFGAYVALDPFGWIAAKPLQLRAVWTSSADALLAMALGLVPVAGFLLGALGVGMEFEKGTADFLLTRPRARHYLLWMSWGVGAAQMVVLMVVSNFVQFARTTALYGLESPGALRPLAAYTTLALLMYSLTYLMTTLARNSRNGTGLAILTLSAYGGLAVWLRLWYEVRIPFFMDLYKRSYRAGPDLPLAVAGWLTVSLLLMLAAQWRFQRAEV